MKPKVYHLSTCNTCKRILGDWGVNKDDFEVIDLKNNPISEEGLEELYKETGAYESLFNRRSTKYRSLGLNEKDLSEEEYKKYLLQEYTFLKRPTIIIKGKAYVGNSKKVVQAALDALTK